MPFYAEKRAFSRESQSPLEPLFTSRLKNHAKIVQLVKSSCQITQVRFFITQHYLKLISGYDDDNEIMCNLRLSFLYLQLIVLNTIIIKSETILIHPINSNNRVTPKGNCTSRRRFLITGLITTSGAILSSSNPQSSSASVCLVEDFDEANQLLQFVDGRRPSEFSSSERLKIDSLIDKIVEKNRGTTWKRERLPGTWRVVYLRPGSNGTGLDRRIPFPEFSFNESYQRFTLDSVINIGELLGPAIRIVVSGSLSEEDESSLVIPKRFSADIYRGDLCIGGNSLDDNNADILCVKLPISGVGVFNGVYLGERLRIGQSLNGGGAIVVQTKL